MNSGEIRPQIAEVLMDRAAQCKVFNFDELIKFYRSNDATKTEKKLLQRLYLVFITPRAAFENGMLKLRQQTMDIYDDELMSKNEKK